MDYERYREQDGTMPIWVEKFKQCEKYIEDALEYIKQDMVHFCNLQEPILEVPTKMVNKEYIFLII